MSRQVKRMNDRSEAKKMGKWKITDGNIKSVPVVGLYKALARQELDWWKYITELIDNTLTLDRNTNVEVIINLPKKQVTIIDDSIGIPGKYLNEIIQVGKQVNKGKQLLSYSGTGMKAAIFALAENFEIITKPRAETDKIYQLIPNFTLEDESEKEASFSKSEKDDKYREYGTEVKLSNITGQYPQKITTLEKCLNYIGATYADYIDSGKLKCKFHFIQQSGKKIIPVQSIRPLLTNPNNMLDPTLNVGANEPERTEILKGKAGKGWEVEISAGRKLYPQTAEKYYGSTNPELVDNVYGEVKGPYAWSSETAGINFKSSGIDTTSKDGKILMFNQFPPSSRAENLWVEVRLIKGIPPTMMKSGIDMTKDESKEMIGVVKDWLKEHGFRRRSKVGTQVIGENHDVRDEYKRVIKENALLRQEWGVSLDEFDEQVSIETELNIGRPDILVTGRNKTIVVEAKKEEIRGQDVSQAAGYAAEIGADQIILVAQRLTPSGTSAMAMWKKILDINIIFDNILNHKVVKRSE
tara:strand:- start:549 stop:2123 length:1575 start_codon:yes stop_codon:yes gene_type:complete